MKILERADKLSLQYAVSSLLEQQLKQPNNDVDQFVEPCVAAIDLDCSPSQWHT
jgi:SPX domain protein involved in polyphosphate accumulation